MKMLVTGGAGFIGCNFVKYAVDNGHEVTVLDKLTYAGNKRNLQDVMKKITFVIGDITNTSDIKKALKGSEIIVHFAAETHVDNSIKNAEPFVRTNVLGTLALLEVARDKGINKFLHVSTDEVYGSIEKGFFRETDVLSPRNPYSATKAAAEHAVYSFFVTHGVPAVITRSSNNFGPFQNKEKLIPKLIANALADKPLPIYGKGKNVRDWLFVEDNCAGIMKAIENGKNGEIYNIGGGNETQNIEIANKILEMLGKPKSLIQFVQDRPGHDFRYALDISKMKKLGWKPEHMFDDALRKTVEWYKGNKWFWS